MKIWESIRIFFIVKWESLKSVWAYLPIIWRDRDFDYSCLLDLMEFKFKRMADHFLNQGCCVDHEDVARDLRVAAQLCARIREEEYDKIEMAAYDKKWGKNCDDKQAVEEIRAIMKRAVQQQHNDLNYLGKMISEKLLGWWD